MHRCNFITQRFIAIVALTHSYRWLIAVRQFRIFMTLVLSLFIFQSLWNVAAAFCTHENTPVTARGLMEQHFGHHLALNCQQDQQQHQTRDETGLQTHTPQHAQLNNIFTHLADDHSDHLPSFAHFIVIAVVQQAETPIFTARLTRQTFDWHNLYQSPHLYLPSPPPVFAPL